MRLVHRTSKKRVQHNKALNRKQDNEDNPTDNMQ